MTLQTTKDIENNENVKKTSLGRTILSPPQKRKGIDWVLLFAVFVMGIASLSMWNNWELQETQLSDVINEVKINRNEVKLSRNLAERNEHEYSKLLQEKINILEMMDKIKLDHSKVFVEQAETNRVLKVLAEKLMSGPRHTACDTVQILNDLRLRGVDLPPYPVEKLCTKEKVEQNKTDLLPLLQQLKTSDIEIANHFTKGH